MSTHTTDRPSDPGEAPEADAVISTKKLSKTFSLQSVQQHVLKNMDLRILRGDFTVVMGPSGEGKSTLLYALSGMDRLAVFRRSHCGFVFQQMNLLDSMSLMDNVMAPGLLTGRKRAAVAQRAVELFDLVDIDAATRKKFPGMVSGGEAQRAAIVRALINEPDVLFADEPTGQLNSENSTKVLDLLTRINGHGQSIVMVTHDVRSAVRGNRILYLRDGTVKGELDLGAYAAEDEGRTARLSGFLADMGW